MIYRFVLDSNQDFPAFIHYKYRDRFYKIQENEFFIFYIIAESEEKAYDKFVNIYRRQDKVEELYGSQKSLIPLPFFVETFIRLKKKPELIDRDTFFISI